MFNEFSLEIDGIIGTISKYTNNPYIIGYINALRVQTQQRDTEMLELTIRKILDWYKKEYESIIVNEYIYDKDIHFKTKELLEKYYKLFQNV